MTQVIDRNILHNGRMYNKGDVVEKDNADYEALKDYLIDEKDLPTAPANKTVRVVENKNKVDQSRKNREVEDPKPNKSSKKATPASTPSTIEVDPNDREEEGNTVDIPDAPDADTPPLSEEDNKPTTVEGSVTEEELLKKTNPEIMELLEKKGFKKGEDFNEKTVKKDLVRLYLEG